MRPLVLGLTLLLVSCNGGDGVDTFDPDTDTDTDTDSDTDSDTDTDTEKCSPDEDGDGFCPPEDCDDTTIWVNPAWDENPDDDIDNNCDGRIDELFSRVLVVEYDSTSGSSLIEVDGLGDLRGTTGLTEVVSPRWVSPDRNFADGIPKAGQYIAWDPFNLAVVRVSRTGALEIVGQIPEEEEWLNDEDEPDPPYYLSDIAVHPDGYYLVAAADRLVKFEQDGSYSTIAQWACVEEDETHEFCVNAMATDPFTGVVMMYGYFGGVAKWTPAGGVEILQPSDPENPGPQFLQAQYKTFETWFAMGAFVDEDTGKGAYGIFRWNRGSSEMVLLGTWPEPQSWIPNSFDIEQESGDFYFAVNGGIGARGAYHNQVWRMTSDGTYATDLFKTDPDKDTNFYSAAMVYYDQD